MWTNPVSSSTKIDREKQNYEFSNIVLLLKCKTKMMLFLKISQAKANLVIKHISTSVDKKLIFYNIQNNRKFFKNRKKKTNYLHLLEKTTKSQNWLLSHLAPSLTSNLTPKESARADKHCHILHKLSIQPDLT